MTSTVTQHARTVALGSALATVLAVALAAYVIAAGHARESRTETTVLRYQDFAGQIGVAELAADLGYLPGLRLQPIGDTTSGPQDIQATVNGDVAFGTAFNGSILRMAGAGAPITPVIAAQGLSPDTRTSFAVRRASPVHGPRGLLGKRVGVTTIGAQAEDVLDLYLERAGLTPDQIRTVRLVLIPPGQLKRSLRTGQIDAAALPGPPPPDLRELFSDYTLLGHVNAASIVMRTDFIAHNPHTVRTFVTGVARALEWTHHHTRADLEAHLTQATPHRHMPSPSVATPGGTLTTRDFTPWLHHLEQQTLIPTGAVRLNALYTNAFNPYAHRTAQKPEKTPPK